MTNTLHSYGGVFFLHHHHDSIFTTLVSLDNYDVWKKSSVFCPGAEKRRVVVVVVVGPPSHTVAGVNKMNGQLV